MISLGSAIRPGPSSPQACKPSFGPIISTPSERRVAIFRCVAECCHFRWFIAGAINVGASVAKYKVDNKLLAAPDANWLREFAVAGAIINPSAHRASSIWLMDCSASKSQSSSRALFPEMAESAVAVTNCLAFVVKTGITSAL